AMRYVEALDARAVVPSAGPPCFLDPELERLNIVDGGEPSIFTDQRSFLELLDRAGRSGVLVVPGSAIEVTPTSIVTSHPMPTEEVSAIFGRKREHLRAHQRAWSGWLAAERASWSDVPELDLLATLREWWEP